jgi:uncharacterized protein with gpF-like domain
MEKMTNVKALNYVLENCELSPEVREKVENIRNQFEKKNGGEKKPTANQVANDNLRSAILAEMEPNVLYTVTDMMKKLSCCAELSNQKISALIRTLVDSNVIEKTVDKRKSYFRKIG